MFDRHPFLQERRTAMHVTYFSAILHDLIIPILNKRLSKRGSRNDEPNASRESEDKAGHMAFG
jgi:hypothetical protein